MNHHISCYSETDGSMHITLFHLILWTSWKISLNWSACVKIRNVWKHKMKKPYVFYPCLQLKCRQHVPTLAQSKTFHTHILLFCGKSERRKQFVPHPFSFYSFTHLARCVTTKEEAIGLSHDGDSRHLNSKLEWQWKWNVRPLTILILKHPLIYYR